MKGEMEHPSHSADDARAVAEAARETEWTSRSFVRELFEGRLRLGLIHPFPAAAPADVAKAKPFFDALERFLVERVDSDRIDREGQVPADVIDGLRALGAFGIKIPEAYGGLGLSQLMYTHAIGLVTSWDGSLTALLSASQSHGFGSKLHAREPVVAGPRVACVKAVAVVAYRHHQSATLTQIYRSDPTINPHGEVLFLHLRIQHEA